MNDLVATYRQMPKQKYMRGYTRRSAAVLKAAQQPEMDAEKVKALARKNPRDFAEELIADRMAEATFTAGTQTTWARGLRLGVHSGRAKGAFTGTGRHISGYKVPTQHIHRQRVKARKSRRAVPRVGRKNRARLYYSSSMV